MALKRARLRLVADTGENVILETNHRPRHSGLSLIYSVGYIRGDLKWARSSMKTKRATSSVTNDEEVREMTRYARLIESEGRSYDPLLVFPKSDSSLNVNNLNVALNSSHRDI